MDKRYYLSVEVEDYMIVEVEAPTLEMLEEKLGGVEKTVKMYEAEQEARAEQKITIAEDILQGKQQDLNNWNEALLKSDTEYIGETLKQRIKQLSKWLDETKVEVEALEQYITNLKK